MYGNAHKSSGSAFMILRRLNLHRYRRIVNQTLMLPSTFLLPAQQESPEVNISVTQVLLVMATGLCLAGPLVWMFVRYWLFAL
jgi:hypothetical protein